jgi:short-subunit dehydrogenase
MKRFTDRVAVVTGASSGIGAATAELLARRGCDVALVDLDEDGMRETADRIRAAGRKPSLHRVDVADRSRMQALPEEVIAEHGRVNILVNNAGVSVASSFEDHDLDDFEWIVGINFWGVVYGCAFFLPYLRREDEAHIVNLSSMFGFVGWPEQSSYCATKFAVRGLSESLWAELSDSSVGVTSVHPGGIATQIVDSARFSDDETREEASRQFKRFGAPPELAARKIVRAIERNRMRLVIRPEAYVTDWIKRAFPGLTHRLIAWIHRRRQAA